MINFMYQKDYQLQYGELLERLQFGGCESNADIDDGSWDQGPGKELLGRPGKEKTDLRGIQEELKSKNVTGVSGLCLWVHGVIIN